MLAQVAEQLDDGIIIPSISTGSLSKGASPGPHVFAVSRLAGTSRFGGSQSQDVISATPVLKEIWLLLLRVPRGLVCFHSRDLPQRQQQLQGPVAVASFSSLSSTTASSYRGARGREDSRKDCAVPAFMMIDQWQIWRKLCFSCGRLAYLGHSRVRTSMSYPSLYPLAHAPVLSKRRRALKIWSACRQ